MSYRVSLDDAGVRSVLDELAAAVGNLEPAMTEIGAMLVRSTLQRFETAHDPMGRPWAPLAKSTLANKRRKGNAAPRILHERGLLRQSVTFRASRTGVEIGTPMVYGPIHQFGGQIMKWAQGREVRFRNTKATRKDGTEYSRKVFAKNSHKRVDVRKVVIGEHWIDIPARPFLGFNATDRDAAVAILRRHLAAAANGGA